MTIKNITTGDVCSLSVWEALELFAIKTVIAVREATFVELSPEDWGVHEPYDPPDVMYAVYATFYRQSVDLDTPFKIIKLPVVSIA